MKATDKNSTASENIQRCISYLHVARETRQLFADNDFEIPFSDPLEDEFPTYAVQAVFGEFIFTPDGWMFFQSNDGGRPQMIATLGNAAIAAIACTILNNLLTHPSCKSHGKP